LFGISDAKSGASEAAATTRRQLKTKQPPSFWSSTNCLKLPKKQFFSSQPKFGDAGAGASISF
jgi:hypothetical protein